MRRCSTGDAPYAWSSGTTLPGHPILSDELQRAAASLRCSPCSVRRGPLPPPPARPRRSDTGSQVVQPNRRLIRGPLGRYALRSATATTAHRSAPPSEKKPHQRYFFILSLCFAFRIHFEKRRNQCQAVFACDGGNCIVKRPSSMLSAMPACSRRACGNAASTILMTAMACGQSALTQVRRHLFPRLRLLRLWTLRRGGPAPQQQHAPAPCRIAPCRGKKHAIPLLRALHIM